MSQEKHAISKTKRELFIKSETDRTAELPDDILSSIISYFNVRDAANASVLSSRWRPLCASSLSELRFNYLLMFPDGKDYYTDCDDYEFCKHSKDIFVRGVNQFLQFYQGTQLVSFKVEFCLAKDSNCDIDKWVSFAIRMGAETLCLRLCCQTCYFFQKISKDRDLYTLRSKLLVQGNVAKVHKLTLYLCIVERGVINQFSSLNHLGLASVILDPREIESVVSSCSSLEYLAFCDCTLPLQLCISGSLHLLKHLSVAHCRGAEMIDLSATNLTSFDYSGCLISFSFPRNNSLKKIHVRAQDGKLMQYIFNQLGKDLPLVETLSLNVVTKWVQCLPERVITFSKIKVLEFCSNNKTKFDVLRIIEILKACPLMEKLHLVIGSQFSEQGMQQLHMQLPPESVHRYLKEVHIGGFHFNAIYIGTAIYILEYAVALERMVIDPELKFYAPGNTLVQFTRVTWDEGEREKVCSYLQGHSKSSMINVIV